MRFPYHITEYSQIVTIERSLDDLLAKDKSYCCNKTRKIMEKKYKMASYSKGWPIIKDNDNDVTIEFF